MTPKNIYIRCSKRSYSAIPPVWHCSGMTHKKARPAPPKAESLEEANGIIQALWDRLNDIEDRLKQNSRNPSRPPSSDGFTTPGSTRKPSGKARGAQPSHKGSKRLLVDEVDSTEQHFPASYCQCGGEVIPSSTPYRRHQIFDIPAQACSVEEHQLFWGSCDHGELNIVLIG